jgi:hypothetical protein
MFCLLCDQEMEYCFHGPFDIGYECFNCDLRCYGWDEYDITKAKYHDKEYSGKEFYRLMKLKAFI